MARIIFGIYSDPTVVERAVHELNAAGYPRDNISLVARTPDGACAISDTQDHDGDGTEHGMGTGVAIGGAIGALAMGVSLIAIPALGALAVGGPLFALVLATGIGAAAGGLVGTLADMGVSKEEAEFYCSAVRRGGILVAVKVPDDQCERAEAILKSLGATSVSQYDATVSPEDLHEIAEPVVYVPSSFPADHGFEEYLEDFRAHYIMHFSESGFSFDTFRMAYEYGFQLGSEASGISLDWALLEPEAQADWDQRNGATWAIFRDAVRFGWDVARRPSEANVG